MSSVRRRCDRCQKLLDKRKGHGWPTDDGKAILCSACIFPDHKRPLTRPWSR